MRRITAIFLALTLLCGMALTANTTALAADSKCIYTVLDEAAKTARLDTFYEETENLIIPDEVDGYAITELGYHCVYENQYVKNIHIGKNVETVSSWAFVGSVLHESFTVDEENQYFKAEDGILYDITGKTLVRCPENYPHTAVHVPEGVTALAVDAFNFYSHSYQKDGKYVMNATYLQELTLPNTLQSIGGAAFGGSHITELYVPDSVTETFERTFSGMSYLKSIYLGAGVQEESALWLNSSSLQRIAVSPDNPYLTVENNVLFSKDKSVLYCYPGGYKDNTFYRLPDEVRTIETNGFIYSKLSSIDFNQVEVIKSHSFNYSHVMEDWVLPQSVTSFVYVDDILSTKTKSFTFLNPKCSISVSWFSSDTYNVTIYGFPGSTAEDFVKRNRYSKVTLTFVPLHTAATDADIYSSVHSYQGTYYEPTCTEQGYTLQKCSVCGLEYRENYQEPLGHHYVVTSAILPTCTEDGYTVYTCSRCGDKRIGNQTGATGHSYTVTERVEPTCTEGGYMRNKCVFCGEMTIEYDDAIGHSYVAGTPQAATCTEAGFTVYTCSRCGSSYQADAVAPLGHRYSTKVLQPATMTDEGTLASACERCGKVAGTAKINRLQACRLSAAQLTYTGDSLPLPTVAVTDAAGQPIAAAHYSLTYTDRATDTPVSTVQAIGQYKVKVAYSNYYTGTDTLYFSVLPPAVTLRSVTAQTNGATVTWEPDTALTGYELAVSTDKDFATVDSVMKVTDPSAGETVLTGLTPGVPCYVKLRGSKTVTVDGKQTTLYGAYSAPMAVTPLLAKTGWSKENGAWYYRNSAGKTVTGWQKIGSSWYYFNASGAMLTGWQKLGGKWYYLSASGAMVTGWQKVSGKWYYFDASGAMLTGWLKDGGQWYYLDSSGAMVASASRTIGGKTYQFNSSGVCTNP